ncbi:hypothetical protein [Paenibacillus sp. N3.4]|nr:hypothetical protein [Paenibacillus sp. N3.4]
MKSVKDVSVTAVSPSDNSTLTRKIVLTEGSSGFSGGFSFYPIGIDSHAA